MAEQEKDQKTEEATPRKLQEARDEGQVALSQELVAALALCSGFAALALVGGHVWQRAGDVIVDTLSDLPYDGRVALDRGQAAEWLRETISSVAAPLALIVAPAIFVSALVGYGQVGFRITPKAVRFDPNKINPAKGFSRLFSARSVVRTVLSAAKILLIGGVMVLVAWHQVPGIVRMGATELRPLLPGLGVIALRCSAAALGVILVLAVVDFAFQRWQFKRDQRMSKQEVREEHKMTDGDPQLRGRMRQIQREMATRRMMADVPRATVVVTNPTHYAVALRYEREDAGSAPLVVAKGAGHVAQRIKALAAEAGVVLHEDVPLARALHAQTEVGQEVPEELFAAVAAVIASVYRLRDGLPGEAVPA